KADGDPPGQRLPPEEEHDYDEHDAAPDAAAPKRPVPGRLRRLAERAPALPGRLCLRPLRLRLRRPDLGRVDLDLVPLLVVGDEAVLVAEALLAAAALLAARQSR